MDLKTIQMLLGHSSMATTTIYTEVSSELKKRVVAALHPRAAQNRRSADGRRRAAPGWLRQSRGRVRAQSVAPGE